MGAALTGFSPVDAVNNCWKVIDDRVSLPSDSIEQLARKSAAVRALIFIIGFSTY
eukprot:gene31899-8574_t